MNELQQRRRQRRLMTLAVAGGALAALPAAGCKDNEAAGSDAAPGGPSMSLIGGFDVSLVPEAPATDFSPAVPAQTGFIGAVRSGPLAAPVAWRQLMEVGPCRVLQPEAAFCDPACVGGAVCAPPGRCQAQPAPRSAGTVRVTGLSQNAGAPATEIVLAPDPPRFVYQLPASVTLAFPPTAPGAQVQVSGGGGDIGNFTLTSKGISPLALQGEPTVRVETGRAVALRWARPDAAETGNRIEVSLNLSVHGGTKGKIECAAADGGSLDIDATLITRLIDLGVAGFPSIVVTRRSAASVTLPAGVVQLNVFSEVTRLLDVPGLISCEEDMDCPTGQTCQSNKLCK